MALSLGQCKGRGGPGSHPRGDAARMQCGCWGDAPTDEGREWTGPAGEQTLISVLVVSEAGAEEHGLSVAVLCTPSSFFSPFEDS